MKRRSITIIAGIWLSGLFIVVQGCGGNQEKIVEIPPADLLLASEIMGRTIDVYAACSTYRDSGVMTRTFFADDGVHQETQVFTTVFQRPYRFRFECREGENRYIIYADAAAVRAWWNVDEGVQPMASVDDAIGRAVGPSNGTAHTIPRLLMPEKVRGRSLNDLRGLERLPDAMLGDIACYRLTGTDRYGDFHIIWIGRETFLVHRIDEEHTFPEFATADRTVYHPELNIELDDAEFDLGAPGSQTMRSKLTARLP